MNSYSNANYWVNHLSRMIKGLERLIYNERIKELNV